ncbi:MAG: hypothetical protein ACYSTF_08950 [Planctomycetota bacterium]|jgi:hypothetical protein
MNRIYENFPTWIPSVSCAWSLAIYALGFYILAQLGILFAALYMLFCVWVESRILKESCTNCYYYGKTCGLGRGKLSALLFKKGDPQEFIEREMTWKNIVPDFLVFILPLIGGVIYLIRDFTLTILALIAVLTVLSLGGNAILRGALVCKHCKQKELGCPAERLFGKPGSETKEA